MSSRGLTQHFLTSPVVRRLSRSVLRSRAQHCDKGVHRQHGNCMLFARERTLKSEILANRPHVRESRTPIPLAK
jgi:hypothetical protein